MYKYFNMTLWVKGKRERMGKEEFDFPTTFPFLYLLHTYVCMYVCMNSQGMYVFFFYF